MMKVLPDLKRSTGQDAAVNNAELAGRVCLLQGRYTRFMIGSAEYLRRSIGFSHHFRTGTHVKYGLHPN
jgi:hypothetical protein